MGYLDQSHHDIDAGNARPVQVIGQTDAVDRPPRTALLDQPAELIGAGSLGRWTRRIVIATAVWSVFELPFEMWISTSTRDAITCVAAKLLWVALVGFVLAGSRVARVAYAFLCTIGLMAVAFSLPLEYRVFPLGFVLSSVECMLKATAFVCLVSAGVYPAEE
ncbi:hypothetical protein ABH945_006937 [Paraburkholderia sp. GAS333]|uniref:hypothetical protein n=1 Tax=Paraburkholderia sp. GAS333 TaxID=3156279 RepID=UPI003D234EBE